MKKEIKYLFSYLFGISILLYGAQRQVQLNIFNDLLFFYHPFSIYLFHFLVTAIILVGLIAVKNTYFEKTGFAFMAFSLLKMLASIIFLLPLIQAENMDYIPDVLAFFIPYFLFLLFEIFYAIKILNSKPKE